MSNPEGRRRAGAVLLATSIAMFAAAAFLWWQGTTIAPFLAIVAVADLTIGLLLMRAR